MLRYKLNSINKHFKFSNIFCNKCSFVCISLARKDDKSKGELANLFWLHVYGQRQLFCMHGWSSTCITKCFQDIVFNFSKRGWFLMSIFLLICHLVNTAISIGTNIQYVSVFLIFFSIVILRYESKFLSKLMFGYSIRPQTLLSRLREKKHAMAEQLKRMFLSTCMYCFSR